MWTPYYYKTNLVVPRHFQTPDWQTQDKKKKKTKYLLFIEVKGLVG